MTVRVRDLRCEANIGTMASESAPDYSKMMESPEDMAKKAKSLDWLLGQYHAALERIRDAIPQRLDFLLKQEWAQGLTPASSAKVRKQVMARFLPHWQLVQAMRERSERLGRSPKIKMRMIASVMSDYSEAANLWRLFDVTVPGLVRQLADKDALDTAPTFQESVKAITDGKGWRKAWRYAVIAEPPSESDDAVKVWHTASRQQYPISRAYFEEHWDVASARELNEGECKWGAPAVTGNSPTARVFLPKQELLEVEVGVPAKPFIGTTGTLCRNACIVMNGTQQTAGPGTDGSVKRGEDSAVFEGHTLHALRVANELNFYEPSQWQDLVSQFDGMIGDTSLNVMELNQELAKLRENKQ